MANTAPKKFKGAFTMRTDEEFFREIAELQRLSPPDELAPSAAQLVREAIREKLERARRRAKT